MDTKTKILLDNETAEKVRERMRAEIKQQFGGTLPPRVEQLFENTLKLFPEITLTKAPLGEFIPFETVILSNETQICYSNGFQIIEDYSTEYHSGVLEQRITPLERKVWGLSEKQYSKLITDENLPIEQRIEINEAWKSKPDAEKELTEALLNDNLTIEERLNEAYKFREETNPQDVKDAENERKTKLLNENVNILEKIDDILT